MDYSAEISRKVIALGKNVLRMTSRAGSGHPSSSLSLAHIITVLMYKIMRYDPQDPWNPANDRLVLSEGHAAPIVYAAYADLQGAYGIGPAEKQILTPDDLDSLRQINSPLDGHPNPSAGFPFFDCATGSLGQGLSCACGLILAARLQNIQKRIYVIIGDGESREGQIWEACDFIIENNLHEIVPIFNCNGLGQTGPVSDQQSIDRITEKLKAFGFKVLSADGHDSSLLLKVLRRASRAVQPHAVVARTVKGWGVKSLQGDGSHGKALKEPKLGAALSELDSMVEENEQIPVRNHHMRPQHPLRVNVPELSFDKTGDPDFPKLLQDDPYLDTYKKGIMSTRRASGLALREMGKSDERIVVLDADVSNSTFTDYFAKALPKRFFECGIAEQHMVSTAAGLASSRYIPFVSSFAKFLTRGYDQLELALIAGLNLKLIGSHTGVNIAADGPSQMGLTDMGYMRSLSTVKNGHNEPLVTIFNPACAVAAYKCVQLMVEHKGACYLRTIRQDLPMLYHPEECFEIGGVKRIVEGKDIALLASGFMVHACRRVVEELSEAGVSASLYDCYSFPVNPSLVIDAAANNNGKIVTVEDNYGNGLGAEIASIVSADPLSNAVVKQLFVRRIPKSGITADDVLDYVGIGV